MRYFAKKRNMLISYKVINNAAARGEINIDYHYSLGVSIQVSVKGVFDRFHQISCFKTVIVRG